MTLAQKLTAVAENSTRLYEAGRQAEYDRFWDSFQQNGSRRNYPYALAGSCWKDDTYDPKYPIIVTNMATSMFGYNSVITSTKVPITIDSAVSNTGVFMGCTRLKTIPSLKVTDKVATFATWFTGCSALTDVGFTPDSQICASISFSDSPLLSQASVDSIVNALKDLSGAKAQTLTLHDAVKETLTDGQKATLTMKNWRLA